MEKNILRVILIILLGITFYTIFQFSSEDADKSSATSGNVIRTIINILPNTKDLNEQEKIQIISRTQTITRKLAHFSIYTFVGISTMSLASTYQLKSWKQILISISVGFIYASLDEYHQSFVPGRSGELRDVLIDTTGVIIGTLLIFIGISIYEQKIKKI